MKYHQKTITDENSPVKIYVNKIKNRIVLKKKNGYKLELLSEEAMQLLGSSKKDIKPHSLTMLKATNAEFSLIEICSQIKIIDHLK